MGLRSERLLDVIDGKTGNRSVPLTRRAVDILRTASAECSTPDTKLFQVYPVSITQALVRARRKLGLSEDIRFH